MEEVFACLPVMPNLPGNITFTGIGNFLHELIYVIARTKSIEDILANIIAAKV